ncbi:hypothetical protein Tco_1465288 [Tanacetum coccineum]
MDPLVNKRRRKRGNNEAEANAPPKVLRRDHDAFRPAQSTRGGKSLASMGLDAGLVLTTPAAQGPSTAMKSLSSKGTATKIPTEDVATAEFNVQFFVGSLESGARLCPFVVVTGPYLSTGVGLRKKAGSKIARRDHRITVKAEEIKTLDPRIQSSGLVLNLQAQVTGEEKIKAAFEEYKKYEDDKVEQRCAEMDVRLDKLSVDFDEELYPHMLTAIAGRRWVIGHGLRLAVMKCAESSEIRQAFADVVSAGLAKGMSEGLKYGIEHGKAGRDLADVEAYDPEANSKLVKALQDLKDLKYPIVDQLERLKDAPMELLMASLHLKSDTREDAPQWIGDDGEASERPSGFQTLPSPPIPKISKPEVSGGESWRSSSNEWQPIRE